MPNPNDNTLPPAPTPPAPPAGAMDKGVTGADPANALMAEATRLGGPLGGIAIGAATGAAHHIDSQNQSAQPNPKDVVNDPAFHALSLDEQHQVLSSLDPDYQKLSGMEQQSVLHSLNPMAGKTAGIDAPITDESEYSDPATGMTLSQMADPRTLKMAGTVAGMEVGGLAAAPIAATTLLGAVGQGAVAGGVQTAIQNPIDQIAAGENPFRLEMMKQTAARTAEGSLAGGITGGVLHGAGKLVEGAANKIKGMFTPSAIERPELFRPTAAETPQLLEAGQEETNPSYNLGGLRQVGPEHFIPIPDEEIPTLFPHGTPTKSEQDFTNAVIANMRQGKNLGTEEVNLLKQYVGDKIQQGSTPMNTAIGAVKHVNDAINQAGTEMNRLISEAPAFTQSTIEGELGDSLLDDVQTYREGLPLGPDNREIVKGSPVGPLTGDPLNEVFTKRLAGANEALTTTDPAEILKARRALGSNIDWQDINKHPETTQQAKNLIDARIYGALTEKLKTIPGIRELDEVFQPNLELRSWLDKVLPEGVAFDPIEAEAQRTTELAKGIKKNAIQAHNDIVQQNIDTAKRAESIRDARLAENQRLQDRAQRATETRQAQNERLIDRARQAREARINKNWKTAGAVAAGGLGLAGAKPAIDLIKHSGTSTP